MSYSFILYQVTWILSGISAIVVVKVECEWNSLESFSQESHKLLLLRTVMFMFANPCLWRFCLSKQSYESFSLPPPLPSTTDAEFSIRGHNLPSQVGETALFFFPENPSRRDWINHNFLIFCPSIAISLSFYSIFLVLFSAYFPNIRPIFPRKLWSSCFKLRTVMLWLWPFLIAPSSCFMDATSFYFSEATCCSFFTMLHASPSRAPLPKFLPWPWASGWAFQSLRCSPAVTVNLGTRTGLLAGGIPETL